jgi:hypothetical protein
MVKILEQPENQKSAMMDSSHEGQSVGSFTGRNAVDEESGSLRRHGYVLHDRDTKFCAEFRKPWQADM